MVATAETEQTREDATFSKQTGSGRYILDQRSELSVDKTACRFTI